jgi:hypothetical protein
MTRHGSNHAEAASLQRYPPGAWTMREVTGHAVETRSIHDTTCNDAEREGRRV